MLDDIISERLKKLRKLKEAGIDPYPARAKRTHEIAEVIGQFAALAERGEEIAIVGRVLALRAHGGSAFADLEDGSGRLQVFFKKDGLGEEAYRHVLDNLDVGDFLSCTGTCFSTKQNEPTLQVKECAFLTKTLMPLPEKWHGLQDVEERYRKRYLDLIMNPSVRNVFRTRSRIVEAVRGFLLKRGYLEVQTPILQPIYGGASARPFTSKLNSLDMQVYMRISNELYLKRLVVGGFEKVFEFSVDFRNEGIDRSHNPEFVLFEAMIAYKDYAFGMEIIEEITEHMVKEISGGTAIVYQGVNLDFKRPWKRVSMRDAILQYGSLDIETSGDDTLRAFLKKHGIELAGGYVRGNAVMAIFEKFCEKEFIQPTIVYDYPAETSMLAKRKADDPRYVERFEQYVYGMEIGNNYSELNDPGILEENWREQEKALQKGDEEAQRMDKDFITALQIGMPPTCGISISIDRMAMLLTGQKSIRDVILFPFMRPKE